MIIIVDLGFYEQTHCFLQVFLSGVNNLQPLFSPDQSQRHLNSPSVFFFFKLQKRKQVIAPKILSQSCWHMMLACLHVFCHAMSQETTDDD